MAKILYFTADDAPTADEQAAILALQTKLLNDVAVRSAKHSVEFGYGPEETDYVAGSPPDAYAETPVWSQNDLIPATSAIVADGSSVTIGTTKYTFTVANNIITAIATATVGA